MHEQIAVKRTNLVPLNLLKIPVCNMRNTIMMQELSQTGDDSVFSDCKACRVVCRDLTLQPSACDCGTTVQHPGSHIVTVTIVT